MPLKWDLKQRLFVWSPVSFSDLMCFFALILLIGNVVKPTLKSSGTVGRCIPDSNLKLGIAQRTVRVGDATVVRTRWGRRL